MKIRIELSPLASQHQSGVAQYTKLLVDAFLMDKTGKWKLSPAYDICFAYRPGSVWVSQHNLSINGKRKDFTRKDLLEIAEQNSIRFPEKIINDCIALVKKWPQYAANYQVDTEKMTAIDNVLIKELK